MPDISESEKTPYRAAVVVVQEAKQKLPGMVNGLQRLNALLSDRKLGGKALAIVAAMDADDAAMFAAGKAAANDELWELYQLIGIIPGMVTQLEGLRTNALAVEAGLSITEPAEEE